jgi:sec-independent protein translocase protein TatC
MGFFDHLEELRRRLIVSLIALFGAFLALLAFAPRLFDCPGPSPFARSLPPGQGTSPTRPWSEPFVLYFRVAMLAG